MTITFYGEPNLLVIRQAKIGYGRLSNVPLFCFDANGEYTCTDDAHSDTIIQRLKQLYKYEIEGDTVPGPEPEPTVDTEPETNAEPEPSAGETIRHCKKCDFTCTNQGDVMRHYRECHPKN